MSRFEKIADFDSGKLEGERTDLFGIRFDVNGKVGGDRFAIQVGNQYILFDLEGAIAIIEQLERFVAIEGEELTRELMKEYAEKIAESVERVVRAMAEAESND